MKKLLLILICFFVSTPCFSKWEKVGETETLIFYMDPQSIIFGGDSAFYYKKIITKDGSIENPIRCSLSYNEINCQNLMNRLLTDKLYTDKNCSKLGLSVKKPSEWEYYRPESWQGEVNKRLCRK